eukprot:SAG11_NODE_1138_length_5724_cov_188.276978_6_plen_227_part_00
MVPNCLDKEEEKRKRAKKGAVCVCHTHPSMGNNYQTTACCEFMWGDINNHSCKDRSYHITSALCRCAQQVIPTQVIPIQVWNHLHTCIGNEAGIRRENIGCNHEKISLVCSTRPRNTFSSEHDYSSPFFRFPRLLAVSNSLNRMLRLTLCSTAMACEMDAVGMECDGRDESDGDRRGAQIRGRKRRGGPPAASKAPPLVGANNAAPRCPALSPVRARSARAPQLPR